MAQSSYADVIVRNLLARRAWLKLGQADIVARMRGLGFTNWHRQTLSRVEQGDRRLVAEELLGLSLALETTISKLMSTEEEDAVELPSGMAISSRRLLINEPSIEWHGNKPELVSPTGRQEAIRARMFKEARDVQRMQERGTDVEFDADPEEM
jgi:transcriptional regulator with XRE-family HTH domain